jgi:hypothetical protein
MSLVILGMMLTSTIAVFTVYAPGIAWQGYVKPAFPDYAPSGMPDFDERQDLWGLGPGTYTWCGPVAVANSLWWLDSEYESILNSDPVSPPTISDHFALVPAFGPWDDHDPTNVDPLVHALASLMDTDGIISHDGHVGTRLQDLENGIKKYLTAQNMEGLFEVHNRTFPDFVWIDNETEKCQDVEVFLEFYQWTGGIWTNTSIGNPSLENGHFVTCAGADATVNPGELLVSDPLQDAFEAGTAPLGGRSPVAHAFPHPSTVHNDTQYVSQDAYQVALWMGPQPGPYGPLQPVWELVGYLQTMGYDPSWHAFIRAAVATSPKQVAQWKGYVKPAFPDYAPSGMPDFDENQDAWGPVLGTYTWCGPVATANSLWWLDSEYESILNPLPIPPPTISDHFNLVTPYGPWDDHDPQNVDPLVRNLAFLMDTDGQRTGDGHIGTRWPDLESGIKQYLVQQGLAGFFEVHNNSFPDLTWLDGEIEKCQDVELFLEFYQFTGVGWTNLTITNPSLEFGHFVTCAGVNVTTSELLVSDPLQDAFEAGKVSSGRSPALHAYPHASSVHNDAQFVSQDVYVVTPWMIPPPSPYGGQAVWELAGYLQTLGYDPSYHAFIRAAVATSASGVHDVAVTNVKTPKDGCKPMPTVGDNSFVKVNVTVLNEGNFTETFNVTLYANSTVVDTQTVSGLASGAQTALIYSWNVTGWTYGNYTISAYAVPVLGETDTADNTYTAGVIKVVIPGDINGDGTVDIYDAILLAGAYNTVPASPKWNPNADLKADDVIDIYDAIILANHYNQHE